MHQHPIHRVETGAASAGDDGQRAVVDGGRRHGFTLVELIAVLMISTGLFALVSLAASTACRLHEQNRRLAAALQSRADALVRPTPR